MPSASDPDAPGSALQAYLADGRPGRKHPAQIVLEALAAGRRVQLPDRRTYALGRHGPPDARGAHRLSARDFVALCGRLSANQVFEIGLDLSLARLAAFARGRRAR